MPGHKHDSRSRKGMFVGGFGSNNYSQAVVN